MKNCILALLLLSFLAASPVAQRGNHPRSRQRTKTRVSPIPVPTGEAVRASRLARGQIVIIYYAGERVNAYWTVPDYMMAVTIEPSEMDSLSVCPARIKVINLPCVKIWRPDFKGVLFRNYVVFQCQRHLPNGGRAGDDAQCAGQKAWDLR